MDCDAKKKSMVKDIDGSFFELGPGAAALPQSEVNLLIPLLSVRFRLSLVVT